MPTLAEVLERVAERLDACGDAHAADARKMYDANPRKRDLRIATATFRTAASMVRAELDQLEDASEALTPARRTQILPAALPRSHRIGRLLARLRAWWMAPRR